MSDGKKKNHYLCCDVEDSMQKSYLIQNEENYDCYL